ncbi:MAG: hypothetical protein JXR70_09805 [Spirochaetales bacterium]|nr:hypothetical protein [Spirochaetales bacterium]
MAERITNFEDDIFFLHIQIDALFKGLKLNIDKRFFQEKISRDLDYFEKISAELYNALTNSTLMLKKTDYLKNLSRLLKLFNELMEHLMDKKFPINKTVVFSIPRLEQIREKNKKCMAEIKRLIPDPSDDFFQDENMVSEEEYKFLFTETEETV